MQLTADAPAAPTSPLPRARAIGRALARAALRAFDRLNRTGHVHTDLHPADWATAQRLIET